VRRSRPVRRFAPGLLGLALGACALTRATFASYDVAPNGLEVREDRLRRALAAGATDATLKLVRRKGEFSPDDKLLRLLYEGTVGYYAGRFAESATALQKAADLAEDRYTQSLSKEALSLVTNDRARPYTPGQTELLFIHYYALLDYFQMRRLDEAAVEARRLSALLQRFDDQRDSLDAGTRAALHYLAGAAFEAAGEPTDAEVSYRNARALFGDSLVSTESLVRAGFGQADAAGGDVLVVVEDGFVAHRVAQSVYIGLSDDEFFAFGARGDRSRSTSLRLGARVMDELGGTTGYGLYDDGRRDLYLCGARPDHDDGRLLALSWPAYHRPSREGGVPEVVVDDSTTIGVPLRADVTDAVVDDYHRIQTSVIVRAIARAATKYVAAEQVGKAVEKKHGEDAGELARLAVDLTGAAFERADTRTWHLLPDRIGLVRMTLPPGPHRLRLETGGAAGPLAARTLAPVDIRPGFLAVTAARVWSGSGRY
jgi:hypothetical protein